jgi:hypothetical protein
MTKKETRAEINTFIQGLITEASPLNFPVNASVDEDNFELNRDGTRDRRLGMDFEPSYTYIDAGVTTSTISSAAINTFKWYSINGLISKEFLVAQVNKTLFFFDTEEAVLSETGYKGSLVLSTFPSEIRYSFAALEGKLVVAAGVSSVAVVSYNETTNIFSVTYKTLKVRDVWGVEVTGSSYETDESYRSTTIPTQHRYNLVNQSWGIPRKNKAGTLVNPITQYFTDLGVYPSNSEVVWTGLQFQPVAAGADPFERLYTNIFTESLGANVKAPKGYFIIDVLDRGAARASAYATNSTKYSALGTSTISLPTDSTPGGATCIAAFAGRVFYAGFNGDVVGGDARSPVLSDHVLFSKLVRSPTDIYKCHQEGDLASRDSGDLLDTDGGFLRIAGARGIIGLYNLESHLIVLATNGVWAISGGADYGFTATNYKVNKISAFGALAPDSVVIEGGRLFYWSEDGIYVIAKGQVGEYEVNSLTVATIQTFYENIPVASKLKATGSYDMLTKKIRWLYKTGSLFSSLSVTREIVFDLALNAFYTSTIQQAPGNVIEVVSSFVSKPFNTGDSFTTVLSGTDEVLVSTDTVGIVSDIRKSGIQSLRYLTLVSVSGALKIAFSYYYNNSFLDWYSYDNVGTDAKGFILTGSQVAQDSGVEKQIPYLIMHFRRTESGVIGALPNYQSSCKVRSQWNWSNTVNSGKWGDLFQAYRYREPRFVTGTADTYDNGYETIISKNKLRGRGKAFALYIETESLKDCRILGWNLTLNANTIT